MALGPPAAYTGSTAGDAGRPGLEAVESTDLHVAAMTSGVRRELETIVAAGWGGAAPGCPASPQGTRRPHRPSATTAPRRFNHVVGNSPRATTTATCGGPTCCGPPAWPTL